MRLRSLLEGGDAGGVIVSKNPLNPILDNYADILIGVSEGSVKPEDILTDAQMSVFDELQAATEALIKDDSRFLDIETRSDFDAAQALVSEENLLGTLAECAANDPKYRFPEPCQTQKWKEASQIKWAQMVFHPPQANTDSYHRIRFEDVENTLSDCTGADGLSRTRRSMKPNRLGSSNY